MDLGFGTGGEGVSEDGADLLGRGRATSLNNKVFFWFTGSFDGPGRGALRDRETSGTGRRSGDGMRREQNEEVRYERS